MTTRGYREQRQARLPATLWCSTHPGGMATILPDGCMDVIWTGETLLVAGPDSTAAHYVSSARQDLVGVRFDPGVAPSLLGERADALRDSRADLAALWGDRRSNAWADRLAAADDPAATLLQLCGAQLGDIPGWVPQAVAGLRGGTDVAAAARAAGMSARTFQRQVNQRIGYGPKMFQRITRMSDAVGDLRAQLPLTDVAYRRGYADYPHMHREFVALTKQSPMQFVAEGQLLAE